MSSILYCIAIAIQININNDGAQKVLPRMTIPECFKPWAVKSEVADRLTFPIRYVQFLWERKKGHQSKT